MTTPPLQQLSDAELVLRCRDGQQAAWQVLVQRFKRLVYTVPRRAGLSEADAGDVFQVVFSRLFEHLDRLDDPAKVRAWLVTTARNESLRQLQQARRFVSLQPNADAEDSDAADEDPLHALADDAPLPEALLSNLQQQDRLRCALDQLDERCKTLLTLMFLQDEAPSYGEVARLLDMPEGSIGPTRGRCLERLRTLLLRL